MIGFIIILLLLLKTTLQLKLDDTNTNPVEINSFPKWIVIFEKSEINMKMQDKVIVNLTIKHINSNWNDNFEFHLISEDPETAIVEKIINSNEVNKNLQLWNGNFTIIGKFIGRSRIFVELHRSNLEIEKSHESLQVIVSRNITLIDNLFTLFVALFVTVIYVNFGAALDLTALKQILIRPVGPAIGFIGQFLIMPILSFFIGYILFPEMIELRLGLFFTGTSPGGGTSNIFTVIFNGNLDLSIIMTAVSNIAALGMMPLWIFTLGALIFLDGNFDIPYDKIAMFSISLVLPLGIGIMLQKCTPRFAAILSKGLKPISITLIIFITICAMFMNSYLFKLFSWKIVIASVTLPWLGYILGGIMALLLRQSAKDALTIAIETGIQNTGIAIFMLNFTLPQPQADMTSAVPVACALLTPIPLVIVYFARKYLFKLRKENICEDAISKNDNSQTVEVKQTSTNDS